MRGRDRWRWQALEVGRPRHPAAREKRNGHAIRPTRSRWGIPLRSSALRAGSGAREKTQPRAPRGTPPGSAVSHHGGALATRDAQTATLPDARAGTRPSSSQACDACPALDSGRPAASLCESGPAHPAPPDPVGGPPSPHPPDRPNGISGFTEPRKVISHSRVRGSVRHSHQGPLPAPLDAFSHTRPADRSHPHRRPTRTGPRPRRGAERHRPPTRRRDP